MAQQILHGHFFAFYWGQNYGGTEAYAVAAVFALFGKLRVHSRAHAGLLCAGAVAILWRIGNRLFGGPVGAVAAVAVLGMARALCDLLPSRGRLPMDRADLRA